MKIIHYYFKKHPFAIIGLFALPLLGIMVFMGGYFPKKTPEGFQSFIVAFEFAKTIQDLNVLFSDLSEIEIQKIDIGNYVDFGFMLTYSLFLISLFKKASKEFIKKWLIFGILLAVIALLSDFFENLILLEITEIYSNHLNESLFITLLKELNLITWFKWGSLSLAFLLFSVELLKRNWLAKTVAFLCILPVAIGIWALDESPVSITYFTNSVFGAFTILIIYSFVYRRENNKLATSNFTHLK